MSCLTVETIASGRSTFILRFTDLPLQGSFITNFPQGWEASLPSAGLDKRLAKFVFYLSEIPGRDTVQISGQTVRISSCINTNIFQPAVEALEKAFECKIRAIFGTVHAREISFSPSRVDLKIDDIQLNDFETDFDHGWKESLILLSEDTRTLILALANKTSVLRLKINNNVLTVFVECGAKHMLAFVNSVLNRSSHADDRNIKFREIAGRL